VSFAAITLCVSSQRVFIIIVVYFVMTQSGNFWILPRTTELLLTGAHLVIVVSLVYSSSPSKWPRFITEEFTKFVTDYILSGTYITTRNVSSLMIGISCYASKPCNDLGASPVCATLITVSFIGIRTAIAQSV
jgi:hypothetical protein